MFESRPLAASAALLLFSLAGNARAEFRLPFAAPTGRAAATSARSVAVAVTEFRKNLALFRFRIRTTMSVDGNVRIVKLEEVRVGPDGGLVRDRTLRYERKPLPTPYPYGDPRRGQPDPPAPKEEDALWEQSQSLLMFYLRTSADRVGEWATRSRVVPRDPERDGMARWQGRGLFRPWDEVSAYFDAGTRTLRQVEIKTTVSDRPLDIAFIRLGFGSRPSVRSGQPPVAVLDDVFLNMNRGRRRVVVEIDATDFRAFS